MKSLSLKIGLVFVSMLLIIEPIFAQLAPLPREPLLGDARPLQSAPRQPAPPISNTTTQPIPPRTVITAPALHPVPLPNQQISITTDIRQDTHRQSATPAQSINTEAQTPTVLAVKEAIAAPLADAHVIQTIAAKLTPEQRAHTDTIRAEMRALSQLQEQVKNSDTTDDMLGRAEEMQSKIQTLKNELQKLRHNRRQSDAAPSTGSVEKTTDTLDAELATLEQSIAVRDALITELIKQLKTGKSDADSSELSASITAVSEHPVAASGIAIFVFALLWIFRGRIAEFSGFGIKVSFNPDEKKEEGDDGTERRKNDRRE